VTAGAAVPGAAAELPGARRPSAGRVPAPAEEPTGADATAHGTPSIALVARAQAGDAEAFGELYDRYVAVVHRFISHRVSSVTLAEDLTSETFLRALRRLSTFTDQGKDVGAWLVTIARNLIADHFKSSRHRMELTSGDVLEAADHRAGDDPAASAVDNDVHRTLLQALSTVGVEQRECLTLRFLQGLSVAETAAAMGKSEGAVKALQFRAVRALGRALPDGFTA